MSDEMLFHAGVKGMKWGVRKRDKQSSDSSEASRLRKKSLSSLSNAEVRKLVDRQNLEQNYRRLNPSTSTRIRNRGKAALGLATTGVAIYNLVKSPAGQAAISVGKQFASNNQIARTVLDLDRFVR